MFRVLKRIIWNARPRPNGDNIDRLNYSVTSNILVLLIILISIKQYVGEPIQCWIPAETIPSWELYIERYCYIQNTYFVNETNLIMPSNEQKKRLELRYYQWVPVFLSVQMVLFILTRNFWSFASESTGLDVTSITMTAPIQRFEQQKLRTVYSHFGDRIDENLHFASKMYGKFWNIIPYTSYFTFTYLCYKALSCVNVFFQLWMMTRYLNTEYGWLWGIGVLKDLIMERKWKSSGHFPRVTFCDFIRRDETSSAPISFPIQCVLMINMFNELMYILLWFWFTFLAVTNLISAIYWIITSFSKKFRYMCIKDMLEYSKVQKVPQSTIEEFIETRIFWDGLLALRLLAINIGDRDTAGIVGEMFNDYLEEIQAATNESKKKTANNINWKSITLAKGNNDDTNNSNDSGFDGGNNGTNDNSGFDDGGNSNYDNEKVDAMILKKMKNFDENTMIKCLRDFDNYANSGHPISSDNSEEFLKFLQTWKPNSANSSSSSDISSDSSDHFYDEESLLRSRKLQQMLITLDKETFQKLFKAYKKMNNDPDDDVEFRTVFDLYGMIDHMGPMIEAEYEKFVIRQKADAAQKCVVQHKMPTVNDRNAFYEDDQPSQSSFYGSKALSNPLKPPGIPAYRNPFVDPPSESKKIVSEPVNSVAPEVPKSSQFKAPSIKPVSSVGGLSTKNADENRSPKIEKRAPTFDELWNGRVVSAATVAPEVPKLSTVEDSLTTIVLPDGVLGMKNSDGNHSPKIEKRVSTFDEFMKERDVSGAPEVPKPSSNKPVTTSNNVSKKNVDAKNLKATVTDEPHSPKAEKHVAKFDEFMNERVVSAASDAALEIPKLSTFDDSSTTPVLPDGGLGTKNADETCSPKIEKLVEIESMNASVPVTATPEALQILISEDSSIQPSMKNVDETVLPGLAFDHLNLPAELQTFIDLDKSASMPVFANEAFIPKVEVPLPTSNLNNFDDEIDQKPVAEIEAAVGFPGSGIWQGFKNMANSLFGTYAPAPSAPEFENDKIVDSIDADFSVNEKLGIDKNEHFDNQQHEKYDNHEIEADKTFINFNHIPYFAISDTDKSVDSGFINQDTMIIPDNNYEALESAKLGVVEEKTVPSQSASDSHIASDAKIVDVDKSIVQNIIDKPPIKSDDSNAIDFDSNAKVIEAAHENFISYFDTTDSMPISSTNEIHVSVDSPKP